MNRLLIEVVAALAFILAGAGLMWRHDTAKMVAKDGEITALTMARDTLAKQRNADVATLAHLAQKNAAAARESALLRRSLDRALAANPAWTQAPLPKEVSDALQ